MLAKGPVYTRCVRLTFGLDEDVAAFFSLFNLMAPEGPLGCYSVSLGRSTMSECVTYYEGTGIDSGGEITVERLGEQLLIHLVVLGDVLLQRLSRGSLAVL